MLNGIGPEKLKLMHLSGKPPWKLFASEAHIAAQLRTEVAETATQE